jgi:hypothetical protein
MKNKVYLFADIFTETKAKFPHITMKKFEILFNGWRQYCMRRGRNSQYFTVVWQRGWLSPKDADSLREYIGLR